jgi:RecJ-like exonuclease
MTLSRPFQVGRIYRDDDATILADGKRLRVPTMMRDGETNSVCDDCGGTGLYPASVRCPTCGGKNLGETLTDAQIEMQDRLAKDAAWREASIGNRAGFRIDHSAERKAARAKVYDALAQYDTEREAAWRTLPSNVSPSIDTNTDLRRAPDQADHRTTDQVARDHQVDMEQRYRDYEIAAQNAWKTLR